MTDGPRSTALTARLNGVRRRHALLAVASAVVVVAGSALAALAINLVLDRWLDLSVRSRAVLLGVDAVGLLGVAVWRGVWPIVRGPDVDRAARWVERAVPTFGGRLRSAVQFALAGGVGPGTSAAMARATVREAEAIAAGVDFAAVVPSRPAVRLSAGVAGGVVLVVGLVAAGGWRNWAFARRAVLVPGVDYPHRTTVTVDGNVVVARGDSVVLAATAAGDVPAAGRVLVRHGSDAAETLAVDGHGERFERTIANVQEPFAYQFEVGDGTSAERHVRVADRPAVTGLRCRVTPPAYTGMAAGERSPWDLSVVAGSRLGWAVSTNVASTGRVVFVGAGGDVPLVGDGTALTSADVPIPAGATGFKVELTSNDGLRGRDAVVYRIEVAPDRPPAVRLVTPAADGTVTAIASPAVVVDADDDFGVSRVALRYRVTRAGRSPGDGDVNGLIATYAGGAARVEPDVDVSWAATPPPAGVGERFAVRWAGLLRPAVTDEYRFTARVTGGCQLVVDGHMVIDGTKQTDGGPVRLSAGRLVTIELTAPAAERDGEARLSWRGRKVAAQGVPHGCLFPRVDVPAVPAGADGLVGYWPLDDVDGGTVRDAAGSAEGTVDDAVGGDGRIGRAAAFASRRGAAPRVEVAESAAMAYRSDESFSLTAWAAVGRDTKRWRRVVGKGGGDGPGRYGLAVDPGDRWAAIGGHGEVIGPAVVGDGWHHLAMVQDGAAGRRTLYVDGAAVATGPAQEATGGGPLTIGNTGPGGEPFDGRVDDVRLYARALSAEQVRAMAADPVAVRVPTAAELAGEGLPPGTVTLAGPLGRHAERRLAWPLSGLADRPAVGDTVEVWAEATDGNTVGGPGVGASEHRRLRVVSEADKRRELMGQLDDYLTTVKGVSDDQRALAADVATVAGPTTGPAGGSKGGRR